MRISSCWWVAGLVMLAGCVGSGSDKNEKGPSVSTTAAAPVVDAATGAIAGKVVNDELQPIPNARVGILDLEALATTDASGAFTFNELESGTYQVVASAIGFETAGKKIDVVAGEVTEISIVLAPLTLDNEPYVYTLPRTVLIHFGQRFTYSYTVGVANQSVIDEYVCKPCWYVLHMPPSPAAILTEPTWPGAAPCPAINCDVWIYYKDTWTNAWYIGDGHLATYNSYSDRESYIWPSEATKLLKGKDKVLMALNPAYYGSIEQKVTTYTSFAYNDDFAEEFSALPPPG